MSAPAKPDGGEGLTVGGSIEIVQHAQDIERQAKLDRDRLIAERDGWCTIATELLRVAFGAAAGDASYELPPLELLELGQREGGYPEKVVVALRQFWAEVTREYEARRARHAVVAEREQARVRQHDVLPEPPIEPRRRRR